MPSPRPPVPAHATHDELLVARLAGGDDLDPREQAAAAQLVSSCPECGHLASDIAAISRAVAAERVPPRRRDFRITPEQAAGLRGTAIQRLLRRLTLPSTPGALRPLATGALSIGLVLVFVGSVVPGPGPEAEPVTAPAVMQEADDETFATAASPAVKSSDGLGESDARAAARRTGPVEELADTAGGAVDPAATMAMTLEAAPADEPHVSPPAVGAGSMAEDTAAADAGPDAAAESLERALGATASVIPDEAGASDEGRTASQDAADADPGAGTLAAPVEDPATDAPPDDEGIDPAAAPSSDRGFGIGTVLVIVGIGLIAVGSVLAILLVLSRRRAGALRS